MNSTHAVARLGWAIVMVVAAITLTQLIGWSGFSILAVAQSLTPYLGMLLVPIGVVALWRRHFMLAAAAGLIGLLVLVMAAPLAFPDPQADVAPSAEGLTVASANLLYKNDRVQDVSPIIERLDADIIVFQEYTEAHQTALKDTTLASTYPFHVDLPGRGATGIAVWSRHRLVVSPPLGTFVRSLDVVIDGPDGEVRLVSVHMPTPVAHFGDWRSDLDTAARIGREADSANDPTLLIGDLNTSYWHPDFRRLLDAGFVDAHIATGQGFSASWPTTWFIPPFVRLDHALTAGGLVSTEIDDFEIPGSDHRGLVVTVAPAR
ncbi:MAG: endonuclease/exonuclease/phosphatase family protein [Ilumatobacteraceae bacterium]